MINAKRKEEGKKERKEKVGGKEGEEASEKEKTELDKLDMTERTKRKARRKLTMRNQFQIEISPLARTLVEVKNEESQLTELPRPRKMLANRSKA